MQCTAPGSTCSQAHALLPLRVLTYPDLIDPIIQGPQLISVFVEDGLLQLLILEQSLQEA